MVILGKSGGNFIDRNLDGDDNLRFERFLKYLFLVFVFRWCKIGV